MKSGTASYAFPLASAGDLLAHCFRVPVPTAKGALKGTVSVFKYLSPEGFGAGSW